MLLNHIVADNWNGHILAVFGTNNTCIGWYQFIMKVLKWEKILIIELKFHIFTSPLVCEVQLGLRILSIAMDEIVGKFKLKILFSHSVLRYEALFYSALLESVHNIWLVHHCVGSIELHETYCWVIHTQTYYIKYMGPSLWLWITNHWRTDVLDILYSSSKLLYSSWPL